MNTLNLAFEWFMSDFCCGLISDHCLLVLCGLGVIIFFFLFLNNNFRSESMLGAVRLGSVTAMRCGGYMDLDSWHES